MESETSGGYTWRKYGEKSIGSRKHEVRRSYYRCVSFHTHISCPAKKRIDKLASARPDDPPLAVAYLSKHNHPPSNRLSGAVGPLATDMWDGTGPPSGGLENMRAEELALAMVTDLEMQMEELRAVRGAPGALAVAPIPGGGCPQGVGPAGGEQPWGQHSGAEINQDPAAAPVLRRAYTAETDLPMSRQCPTSERQTGSQAHPGGLQPGRPFLPSNGAVGEPQGSSDPSGQHRPTGRVAAADKSPGYWNQSQQPEQRGQERAKLEGSTPPHHTAQLGVAATPGDSSARGNEESMKAAVTLLKTLLSGGTPAKAPRNQQGTNGAVQHVSPMNRSHSFHVSSPGDAGREKWSSSPLENPMGLERRASSASVPGSPLNLEEQLNELVAQELPFTDKGAEEEAAALMELLRRELHRGEPNGGRRGPQGDSTQRTDAPSSTVTAELERSSRGRVDQRSMPRSSAARAATIPGVTSPETGLCSRSSSGLHVPTWDGMGQPSHGKEDQMMGQVCDASHPPALLLPQQGSYEGHVQELGPRRESNASAVTDHQDSLEAIQSLLSACEKFRPQTGQ